MLKINRKQIGYFGAVLLLLVFLHFTGILGPAEKGIYIVLRPVLGAVYDFGTGIRRGYNDQVEKQDLAAENARLRLEVSRLAEENARLNTVAEENKLLRQSLRFVSENEYGYLVAKVIARGEITDQGALTDMITVAAGSSDGVAPGMAVVNSQGILVGKVSSVKDGISEVLLVNNRRCQLAAMILGGESTGGITEGDLGLTVNMGFIPQDREVNIGDTVVTSGLEEAVPRGLVIGRIIAANQESNELWQSATIEPLADISGLTVVTVIIP